MGDGAIRTAAQQQADWAGIAEKGGLSTEDMRQVFDRMTAGATYADACTAVFGSLPKPLQPGADALARWQPQITAWVAAGYWPVRP